MAAALLLLAATAPPWTWSLPAGVAPPRVPADNAMSASKVELGRRLFYDADLSADGTLACASCHEQKRAFADGNATRPGVHGGAGRRNAPGLANVGWFERLTFADPAATSLETQALIPLFGEHPVEMGMKGKEAEFERRLGADRCYRQMFAKAFPERGGRIDGQSVTAALAAFERTIISYGSSYDLFRGGDAAALSPLAQQGERIFNARGCAACHSWPNFTDRDYHRLEPVSDRDRGLVERTKQPGDAGKFRTPSLRNVEMTGPWWHDGTERTLESALARHPDPAAAAEGPALIAFLHTLTDRAFIADLRLARPDTACVRRLRWQAVFYAERLRAQERIEIVRHERRCGAGCCRLHRAIGRQDGLSGLGDAGTARLAAAGDRIDEPILPAAIHGIDKKPGPAIAHAEGAACGRNRPALADRIEQVGFSRAHRNLVPTDYLNLELQGMGGGHCPTIADYALG